MPRAGFLTTTHARDFGGGRDLRQRIKMGCAVV